MSVVVILKQKVFWPGKTLRRGADKNVLIASDCAFAAVESKLFNG